MLLTRVEGEGEIHVYIKEGKPSDIEVKITEAPRFFEYIVIGRRFNEVPDIVSRICGLCGVSYIVTSVRAFEKGLGIEIPQHIELYRRALHGAERIKSHILHAYLMHLPDIIGTRDLKELYQRNPVMFRNVAKIIEWSRKVMTTLGGRFHNVVNIRVGGVYRFPAREYILKLLHNIDEIKKYLFKFMDFVLSLDIPSYKHRMKFLALYNGVSYPEEADKIAIYDYNNIEFFDLKDFERIIKVEQKVYSNALRYKLISGEPYVVGPIARFNIGYKHFRSEVTEILKEYGWQPPLTNIYQSIIARLAETYDTLLFLEEFMNNYREDKSYIDVGEIEPGEYLAAVEAPRGILYHRYIVDSNGRVSYANIITPTAQNLASMEKLIYDAITLHNLTAEEAILKVGAEIIRSFDPCISCSVHSIKIHRI